MTFHDLDGNNAISDRDVLCFDGGGTDVVKLRDMDQSGNKVTIDLATGMTQSNNNSIGDQQFGIFTGDYNWYTGVFTANQFGGHDHIIIYDGDSRSSAFVATALIVDSNGINYNMTINDNTIAFVHQ